MERNELVTLIMPSLRIGYAIPHDPVWIFSTCVKIFQSETGEKNSDTAKRLGVSVRTLQRYRAAETIPANWVEMITKLGAHVQFTLPF